MKKFLLISIILFGCTQIFLAQWETPCNYLQITASGTAGNTNSFQVGSNVDSLVTTGLISSNIQHRWRAYSYWNAQDLVDQAFDTSSICNNCIWSSTLSQDTYSSTILDTLTLMINMTIVDGWTCTTIFGVEYDASSNNNSNGGVSMSMMDQSTSINEVKAPSNKNLFAVYNMLGQKIDPNIANNEILIFIYQDGTSMKKRVTRLP
jgi:hypothetical protein